VAAETWTGVVMLSISFGDSARSKKVLTETVTNEEDLASRRPAVFLICVTSVGFNLMLMT
jgi:hypothetical protein